MDIVRLERMYNPVHQIYISGDGGIPTTDSNSQDAGKNSGSSSGYNSGGRRQGRKERREKEMQERTPVLATGRREPGRRKEEVRT